MAVAAEPDRFLIAGRVEDNYFTLLSGLMDSASLFLTKTWRPSEIEPI